MGGKQSDIQPNRIDGRSIIAKGLRRDTKRAQATAPHSRANNETGLANVLSVAATIEAWLNLHNQHRHEGRMGLLDGGNCWSGVFGLKSCEGRRLQRADA
jgi:hypothetical protein